MYVCIFLDEYSHTDAKRASRPARTTLSCSYMLDTRNEEIKYGILFMFSLFCEYIRLEYVRSHVIYRVDQAEYVIHILVVAPPKDVNTYPTRSNSSKCMQNVSFTKKFFHHFFNL